MSSPSKALILPSALAALAFAEAQAATDQTAQSQGSSSATETLQEVTVTARRANLPKRVQGFVKQIVVPENGGEDGIARWQAPSMCPLVSGLTREEGEFILEQLSQIGREAGVPLAAEQCRPNLFVLVTRRPEDLLKTMEKRDRLYTFGWDASYDPPIETPTSIIDAFIKTPRTVRVWYDTTLNDPLGNPISYCSSERQEVHVSVRCGPVLTERISLSAMTTFSRVFVVVDGTRLHGVTLGQLADYIAMVGFAKLKPGARLGDAPTILKLFDGAPDSAPSSMTDWDQAFLKSLYATDKALKDQAYWISHGIVHDISQDAGPTPQASGTLREVVFTHYDPLFSNSEILRRMVSPLALAEAGAVAARRHETLSPYPLDLEKERFLVYVPSTAPPAGGFALVVFISSRDSLALGQLAGAGDKEPSLPPGWASQLDHYGVIFAAPAHAGNATPVLDHRVPLALGAEENIVREYPIDPEHIYIGGFSGGSHVALHIALSYPDVFRGALLNAGSDPVGDYNFPLPPPDLFLRFQKFSHLVFVTGALDYSNRALDVSSSKSMRQWCVFDVETHVTPGAGHEVMNSAAFGRALDRMLHHVSPDPAPLGACRTKLEAELQEELARAETLISSGNRPAARKLLREIDKRYGGLAAPRSLELAQRCGCGLLDR